MTNQEVAQAPDQAPGQLKSLLRAVHPRQAVAIAATVGLLVAMMGRPLREIAASAVAVLVAQLIAGLLNDRFDADADRRAEVENKPLAEGAVPPGNTSFAIAVLLLLVVPLALQNGVEAGLFLLASLVVAFVHNRWLQRTVLSWVGWAATFALLANFITWGGWAEEADGSAPRTTFVVLSAVLGVCVHFLNALPDLVVDNRARKRHLPLRIALRTGAPALLVLSILATLGVTGLLVYNALTVGIAS